MEKTTMRNTTFEMLRLLAMFMVVLGHCFMASATDEPLSVNDNISYLIRAFTACAVNLFFLLTGYFQRSGNFRLSRLAEIWLKTIFYSVVIYLAAIVAGADTLDTGTLVSYICPLLFKQYWFMQTYIVLALLAPYIMTMLDKLSEQRHLLLTGILLVFFSLHQTFIPVARTLDTTQGYGIIWGGIMLIAGNFLRKYGDRYMKKIKAVFFLLGYIIIAGGIFTTNCLIVKYDIAQGVTSRSNFYAYNSVSVLLEGLCFFCFIIKVSQKGYSSKIINWLSASALSVYLISAHPVLLYPLWTEILQIDRFLFNPALYIAVAVGETLLTMLVCIVLDKILNFISKGLHFDRALIKLDSGRLNQIMNQE